MCSVKKCAQTLHSPARIHIYINFMFFLQRHLLSDFKKRWRLPFLPNFVLNIVHQMWQIEKKTWKKGWYINTFRRLSGRRTFSVSECLIHFQSRWDGDNELKPLRLLIYLEDVCSKSTILWSHYTANEYGLSESVRQHACKPYSNQVIKETHFLNKYSSYYDENWCWQLMMAKIRLRCITVFCCMNLVVLLVKAESFPHLNSQRMKNSLRTAILLCLKMNLFRVCSWKRVQMMAEGIDCCSIGAK